MRASERRTLLRLAAGIASLCAVAAARAQTPVADCNPQRVYQLAPDEIGPDFAWLHPNAVMSRHVADLARGRYSAVALGIMQENAAVDSAWPPAPRTRFATQTDSLVLDLFYLERRAQPGARPPERSPRFDRFALRFDMPSTYTLFEGTADQLEVDAATEPRFRRQLCWRAIALQQVLAAAQRPLEQRAVGILKEKLDLWTNYRRYGYAQFPWELLFNSHYAPAGRPLEPPTGQWILFHPGVGEEVMSPTTTLKADALRGVNALWLEPIGRVWYDDRRTAYYGGSLLLTLPERGGPGYGAMAHIYRFSLGYVFHPKKTDAHRLHALVFSVDLFGLIAKVQQGASD